eukprot:529522-Prymnesium_polylepis.1
MLKSAITGGGTSPDAAAAAIEPCRGLLSAACAILPRLIVASSVCVRLPRPIRSLIVRSSRVSIPSSCSHDGRSCT